MTYYRWMSAIRSWRGDVLQADLVPFDPEWFRIDRWSCDPIDVGLPVIEFQYPKRAPLTDVIFSASNWEPYSRRLRSLLHDIGASFEEFPCRLLEKRSHALVSEDYAVVHFLGCRSCIDWNRSDFDAKVGSDGAVYPSWIRRLALADECLVDAPPIFRLGEVRRLVLADEGVRALLTSAGISGVRFLPLDDDRGF